MALTLAQLAQLKTELETDPNGYGYAPHVASGSDNQLAALLNLARPAIRINRGFVSTQELVEAIVQSEMPSNANQRDWLIMVTQGDRVRVDTGSTARAGLVAIFGAATVTRANLLAISERDGSRAEQLFGRDVRVTDVEVGLALRG